MMRESKFRAWSESQKTIEKSLISLKANILKRYKKEKNKDE